MMVERFTLDGDCIPDPSGELVSYAAYEKLQWECNRLQVALRGIASSMREIARQAIAAEAPEEIIELPDPASGRTTGEWFRPKTKKEKAAEQMAIISKLPVDLQGDPILPNTTRYYIHPREKVYEVKVKLDLDVTWSNYDLDNKHYARHIRESYATEAMAGKALQAKERRETNG